MPAPPPPKPPPTIDYETRADAPDGYGPCPRCGRPRRARADRPDAAGQAGRTLFGYIKCSGCGYTYDAYTGRDDRREVLIGLVTCLIAAAAILAFLLWATSGMARAA